MACGRGDLVDADDGELNGEVARDAVLNGVGLGERGGENGGDQRGAYGRRANGTLLRGKCLKAVYGGMERRRGERIGGEKGGEEGMRGRAQEILYLQMLGLGGGVEDMNDWLVGDEESEGEQSSDSSSQKSESAAHPSFAYVRGKLEGGIGGLGAERGSKQEDEEVASQGSTLFKKGPHEGRSWAYVYANRPNYVSRQQPPPRSSLASIGKGGLIISSSALLTCPYLQ